MYKNKLLLGVFACGLSSIIFASNNTLDDYRPGIYIGVQGGYAFSHKALGLKDYVNDQYDYIIDNYPNTDVSKEIKQNGFGGRVFLGISILPYISMETGYTLNPDNKYKLTVISPASLSYMNTDVDISLSSFDLVAKLILPLERLSSVLAGWNVYGKAGAAVVHSDYTTLTEGCDDYNRIRPTYGFGVGYNFTDSLGVDLSWAQTLGNMPKVLVLIPPYRTVPTTNLISAGIFYKFSWGESRRTRQVVAQDHGFQPQQKIVPSYKADNYKTPEIITNRNDHNK